MAKKKKGFTLVELSIVLVIIGLLIGGILAAKSMISTARNQSIIRDMEKYRIAVRLFKNQYGYLPGSNSGTKTNWFRGTSVNDGWVDGRRGFLMFSEMSSMSMLDQKYDSTIMGNTYGSDPNAANWPGVAIPKLANGAVIYGTSTDGETQTDLSMQEIYGSIPVTTTCTNYNFFALATYKPSSVDYGPITFFSNGAIDTVNAKSIDVKIDDGNGSTGSVLTETAVDTGNNS